MPHRAASPALSENEFDISKSLFRDDDGSDMEEKPRKRKATALGQFSLDMLADGAGNDPGEDGGADNDDDDDETFIAAQQASANRKASNLKGRTVKKGGGFQAMGLNPHLLKAITRKGFSVPTPIQRKTIPLVLDGQDVVGMARTGSGKTAAFVVPMIEKLRGHSAKVGARALILSPSRELALQTLKVVREMGKGTDLKSILLVGGDSLEEQFGYMASNPDIIIATPGRFLHLQVEMNLDLSSIQYAVFDEADRLFEMGFAAQLSEILHALPSTRQTLLFSATLPKSLVEFARAGLQEPTLVRLDAESKISPDLQNAFFTIKSAEKEGALLHILHDVVKVPTGKTEAGKLSRGDDETDGSNSKNPKKRKRAQATQGGQDSPTEHSTIVFVATKHHVDYVTALLRESGFAVSYAYGSLDQTARKIQVNNFRNGISHILVVTDVAARGIDIPILSTVVNYDFPSQPKIFVHRVGRTARAGRKGWSYSLIRDADAPYLLDLQLFLGRRLVVGRSLPQGQDPSYSDDVVVGALSREPLGSSNEWVAKVLNENVDLESQRGVAVRGEKQYMRTRNAASSESAKRARELVSSEAWTNLHPLFSDQTSQLEVEREKMLARVGGFKPQETIFEISGRRNGKSASDKAADTMRNIRSTMESKRKRQRGEKESTNVQGEDENDAPEEVTIDADAADDAADMSLASDSELEVTFSYPHQQSDKPKSRTAKNDTATENFQNPEYFMSYTPASHSAVEDRAYGVHSGTNANFTEASRGATMDLAGDDTGRGFGEPRTIKRWDKRHKKYVSSRNDEDGSKGGPKLVRGESGVKIAASFRSGRFDAWKRDKRISRMPRIGETENSSLGGGVGGGPGGSNGAGPGGKRFRHRKEQAPKRADKLRDDYGKMKKKQEAAKERKAAKDPGVGPGSSQPPVGKKGKAKGELRSVDDVRKARNQKEKRREKNARPSKKKRS